MIHRPHTILDCTRIPSSYALSDPCRLTVNTSDSSQPVLTRYILSTTTKLCVTEILPIWLSGSERACLCRSLLEGCHGLNHHLDHGQSRQITFLPGSSVIEHPHWSQKGDLAQNREGSGLCSSAILFFYNRHTVCEGVKWSQKNVCSYLFYFIMYFYIILHNVNIVLLCQFYNSYIFIMALVILVWYEY